MYSTIRHGSRILKWGVNFCNNVIEPCKASGWGVWDLCIRERKKGAQKKGGGVKIHPFHLPWIRAWLLSLLLEIPLDNRILMWPSASAEFSTILNCLSSTRSVFGMQLFWEIAPSSSSARASFNDLEDTLRPYAWHSAVNSDLRYTLLSGPLPWCWWMKATRRLCETVLFWLLSFRISC